MGEYEIKQLLQVWSSWRHCSYDSLFNFAFKWACYIWTVFGMKFANSVELFDKLLFSMCELGCWMHSQLIKLIFFYKQICSRGTWCYSFGSPWNVSIPAMPQLYKLCGNFAYVLAYPLTSDSRSIPLHKMPLNDDAMMHNCAWLHL